MATRERAVSASAAISASGLVGSYRLGPAIGRGATAQVHEAVDVRTGRRAAVKMLQGGSRHRSEVVARFIREGRALQKMNHPNLVRVIDHGVSDDGEAWMAMERLEGVSLAALIEKGTLQESRALALMIGVAKALASVHARGMVHRDLKPENIFVVAAGTPAEEAKVIDFGVAHVAADDLGEHSIRYTTVGSLLGSIAFMAPELLDGSGREPTAAADVFSFAATLHEALTGEVPFVGDTIAEQQKARARGEIAALGRGRLSPSVEALLRRCLAYAAESRPQSGLELLRELYALQARQSSVPRPAATACGGIHLTRADGLTSLRAGDAPPAALALLGTPFPVGRWASPGEGLGRRLSAAVLGGTLAGAVMTFWLATLLSALNGL